MTNDSPSTLQDATTENKRALSARSPKTSSWRCVVVRMCIRLDHSFLIGTHVIDAANQRLSADVKCEIRLAASDATTALILSTIIVIIYRCTMTTTATAAISSNPYDNSLSVLANSTRCATTIDSDIPPRKGLPFPPSLPSFLPRSSNGDGPTSVRHLSRISVLPVPSCLVGPCTRAYAAARPRSCRFCDRPLSCGIENPGVRRMHKVVAGDGCGKGERMGGSRLER